MKRILFFYAFFVICKTTLLAQQTKGYNNDIIVNIVQNVLRQNPTKADSVAWEKKKAIWKEEISLLNFETKNQIAVHLWNLNKTDELIHYYNAIKKLPEIFFKNYDELRIFKLANNIESLPLLPFRKSKIIEGSKNINSYQNCNHSANEMLGKIAMLKKDYTTAYQYFQIADQFPFTVGYMPCRQPYIWLLKISSSLREYCLLNITEKKTQ